jgi:hypothetical protein
MKAFPIIGHLKSGEAVYRHENGNLFVEKDHQYLVDAKPDEMAEIYEKWPHLKPDNKEDI